MTSKRKAYTSISILIILIAAAVVVFMATAQPSGVIHVPGSEPLRVLPDLAADRYWVVNYCNGLILLTEDQPGSWSCRTFPIGRVIDATGPDSSGRLYCSFWEDMTPMGVYVFDCASETVTDTIYLDYIPRGLVLSPDETKLYVAAWVWPQPGEPFAWDVTPEHPDSGIVLEIDLVTKAVIRSAKTAAMPETIHYSDCPGSDRLLISTHEMLVLVAEGEIPDTLGGAATLDMIDIRSFSRLEPRIQGPFPFEYHCNYLLDWPLGGCYVAVCFPYPVYAREYPEYQNAIWIVDPADNEVVRTLRITDPSGISAGIITAVLSAAREGEVYITVGDTQTEMDQAVLVIDADSGETIKSIDVGGEGWPSYLHETPDGRLIACCAATSKILILDVGE